MTKLSKSMIEKTREHFAQIQRDMIAEVESGACVVDDPAGVIAWCKRNLEAGLRGEHDHSFTFRQRAESLTGTP